MNVRVNGAANVSRPKERQPALVLLHTLHIHLKGGEEHDVIEAHTAEELERVVAHKDVEAILSYGHACQHHAYDVRNAQFAHDDGCQQNDDKHQKEDEAGVGDGKILCQVGHKLLSLNVYS